MDPTQSFPTEEAIKVRIGYDTICLVLTSILIGFFVRNQNLKYKGFPWPPSERLACGFVFISISVHYSWFALSTRERIILLGFMEDVSNGLIPADTTPPPLAPQGHKMKFFVGYGFHFGVWGIKAAFVSCYWSLRMSLTPRVRGFLYLAIGYTAATLLGNLMMHTFSCRPISLNWTGGIHRTCSSYDLMPNLAVLTVTNITTDMFIMAVPLLALKSLGLRGHERWSFAFVFLIGSTSVVAVALRYAFAWKLHTAEGRYDLVELEWRKVFITLETTCAECAFCLPAMRKLARDILDKFDRKKISEATAEAAKRNKVSKGMKRDGWELSSFGSYVSQEGERQGKPKTKMVRVPKKARTNGNDTNSWRSR